MSVQCLSRQHSFGLFLRKGRNFRKLFYKKYEVNQSLLFLASHIHKTFFKEISASTPFGVKERFSYQGGDRNSAPTVEIGPSMAFHDKTGLFREL
jgi:hypothetical protein